MNTWRHSSDTSEVQIAYDAMPRETSKPAAGRQLPDAARLWRIEFPRDGRQRVHPQGSTGS
jgi:hypothetical protein